MDLKVSPVSWNFNLIYLSNIVFFSQSPRSHSGQMRKGLSILQVAKSTLKLNNVISSQEELIFLIEIYKRVAWREQLPQLMQSKDWDYHQTHRFSLVPELVQLFLYILPSIALISVRHKQNLRTKQEKYFGTLSVEELKAMHELQNKLLSPMIIALPHNWNRYNSNTRRCNVQVMSCDSLFRTNSTLLSPKHTLHDRNKSQLVKMDLHSFGRNQPIDTLVSLSFWI